MQNWEKISLPLCVVECFSLTSTNFRLVGHFKVAVRAEEKETKERLSASECLPECMLLVMAAHTDTDKAFFMYLYFNIFEGLGHNTRCCVPEAETVPPYSFLESRPVAGHAGQLPRAHRYKGASLTDWFVCLAPAKTFSSYSTISSSVSC